jgi:ribosomal protein S18 acetylase RimI-like enzyme
LSVQIREIDADEFDCVWPLFQAVVSAGDTYIYDPAITQREARKLWATAPARCFVAEEEGSVVGTYCVKPNQVGLGDHVANAGYMVASQARGRGIGGILCEHSLEVARRAGFRAMQFNLVVVSNEAAVHLWQKHGFRVVGRVPEAFRHAKLGLTDVLIMHRFL